MMAYIEPKKHIDVSTENRPAQKRTSLIHISETLSKVISDIGKEEEKYIAAHR